MPVRASSVRDWAQAHACSPSIFNDHAKDNFGRFPGIVELMQMLQQQLFEAERAPNGGCACIADFPHTLANRKMYARSGKVIAVFLPFVFCARNLCHVASPPSAFLQRAHRIQMRKTSMLATSSCNDRCALTWCALILAHCTVLDICVTLDHGGICIVFAPSMNGSCTANARG